MESVASNRPGRKKRISTPMRFLLIMVGLYIGVGAVDGHTMAAALAGSWQMLVKLMPVMGLVFALNALVNAFLNPGWIEHHLGEHSGWQGWAMVLGFSMVVPGSPFVVYPLIHELTTKGLKKSLVAVFLYNQTVKITFLPAMILYFGIRYTAVLSVFILGAAILNGIVVGGLSNRHGNT